MNFSFTSNAHACYWTLGDFGRVEHHQGFYTPIVRVHIWAIYPSGASSTKIFNTVIEAKRYLLTEYVKRKLLS